jgi:hypothetical protein
VRKFLCRPCKTGVDPLSPKTFHRECWRCQEKLAAGQRTGNEPMPITLSHVGRERVNRDKFMEEVERKKGQRRAQRKSALENQKGVIA